MALEVLQTELATKLMTNSRTAVDRCTACESKAVYHCTAGANGAYGPALLRGLGRLFRPAKMEVYMCTDCGHMQFFADAEARKAVKERFAWKRVT